MNFSVSIKIKIKVTEKQKDAALMLISLQVPSKTPPRGLRHEGEHCSSLCPPRESTHILDQVPQARQDPNWGSSSSSESQTTEFHFSNSNKANAFSNQAAGRYGLMLHGTASETKDRYTKLKLILIIPKLLRRKVFS